mgnify:CR=1 FL=1
MRQGVGFLFRGLSLKLQLYAGSLFDGQVRPDVKDAVNVSKQTLSALSCASVKVAALIASFMTICTRALQGTYLIKAS